MLMCPYTANYNYTKILTCESLDTLPRNELRGFSLSDNYTVILTCERLVTLPRK